MKSSLRQHSYNSYCGNTMFIDVNDDGMMDMYCDSPTQDKHSGWIFLNKGNLNFEKIQGLGEWLD